MYKGVYKGITDPGKGEDIRNSAKEWRNDMVLLNSGLRNKIIKAYVARGVIISYSVYILLPLLMTWKW